MTIIENGRRGLRSTVISMVLLAMAGALLLTGCGAAGSHGTGRSGSAPTVSRPTTSASTATQAAPAIAVQPAAAVLPTPSAPAKPATTPCTTNTRDQYVYVSLRRQHMWMCAKHHVAMDTAITSGMVGEYTQTPTGTFHIQGRNRNTTLTLNTGATYDVKYWIPFQAPLFGFHDASWQDFPYGSAKYKTAGSHGCVHMPLAAIKFLYNWVDTGAIVRIKA